MGIITKMRKQTAVYWAPSTPDGTGGTAFGTATDISCRWEDRAERFTDTAGVEHISRAVVYVDRVLALGGWLRLGAKADLSPDQITAGPQRLTNAFRIKRVDALPNLKATETLRTVYL